MSDYQRMLEMEAAQAYYDAYLLARAEVERLRADLDDALLADVDQRAQRQHVEAEVERLRKENDDLRMRVSVRDDIIGQHYLDAPK